MRRRQILRGLAGAGVALTSGCVGFPFGRRTEWHYESRDVVYARPAIGSDTVYFGDWAGYVYAVEKSSGSLVWERRVGTVASTPRLAGGRVYVGTHGGAVRCLDGETGDERWSVSTNGDVLASPTVAEGTVYVGSQGGTMYAIDAGEGDERWTADLGVPVTTRCRLHGDRIFVSTAAPVVRALSSHTGEQVWKRSLPAEERVSTSVVAGVTDERLFHGYDRLYVLDPRTGDVSRTVAPPDEAIPSGNGAGLQSRPDSKTPFLVTLADERLLCAWNGYVFVLDRSSYDLAWATPISDEGPRFRPVATDSFVVSGGYSLRALDEETGTEAWTVEDETETFRTPAVDGDRLFVPATGGIYAIDAGR